MRAALHITLVGLTALVMACDSGDEPMPTAEADAIASDAAGSDGADSEAPPSQCQGTWACGSCYGHILAECVDGAWSCATTGGDEPVDCTDWQPAQCDPSPDQVCCDTAGNGTPAQCAAPGLFTCSDGSDPVAACRTPLACDGSRGPVCCDSSSTSNQPCYAPTDGACEGDDSPKDACK